MFALRTVRKAVCLLLLQRKICHLNLGRDAMQNLHLKFVRSVLVVLTLVALTPLAGPPLFAQEQPNDEEVAKNTEVPQAENESALADRVQELEQRVQHLERLIFSTAQLTVYDAQRRLTDAETQLGQSRRLFLRGMLDRTRVDYDAFVVERARRELQLAEARDGQFEISAGIELMQAEFNLRVAEQQLEFSRGLLAKGFVSEQQIRREELAVDRARLALDLASQKMDAIRSTSANSTDEDAQSVDADESPDDPDQG